MSDRCKARLDHIRRPDVCPVLRREVIVCVFAFDPKLLAHGLPESGPETRPVISNHSLNADTETLEPGDGTLEKRGCCLLAFVLQECKHYGKSIRKAKLEGDFEALLVRLTPAKSLLRLIEKALKMQWDNAERFQRVQAKTISEEVKKIERQIEKGFSRLLRIGKITHTIAVLQKY